MIYTIFFICGILLNDARILHKIYDNNFQYIKFKLIRNDLGLDYLIACIFFNFLKGFMPFYLICEDNASILFFLACLLLVGVVLGSRPGRTEGSELIVLIGILAGIDYTLIRLPLAIYISLLLLLKSNNSSLFIFLLTTLLNCLILGYYHMFLLTGFLMVNYTFKNYELFSHFKNNIKRNIFPLF